MCGIIGATAKHNITEVLLDGLGRLEYRGYDSAGLALLRADKRLARWRCVGPVEVLCKRVRSEDELARSANIGIAHTRWATQGAPSEANAHPLVSSGLALVHNGIIENAGPLRTRLIEAGYRFESDTDTEAIAHLVHLEMGLIKKQNKPVRQPGEALMQALRATIPQLKGSFALAVIHEDEPDCIVAVRAGSSLIVGVGDDIHLVASDVEALQTLTKRIIFLEEGDLACLTPEQVQIENKHGQSVQRPVENYSSATDRSLGQYQHYMQKEIFEQPACVESALAGRLGEAGGQEAGRVLEEAFGAGVGAVLDQCTSVTLVACGSSYLAGYVAKYWLEKIARLPCQVDIASEYCYRQPVVMPGTLLVTISQSGETADTLAVQKNAKSQGYLASLSLCNVPMSSLPRLTDLQAFLHAGTEVGVASTKAITSTLVLLMLLTLVLARRRPDAGFTKEQEAEVVSALRILPAKLQACLALEADIQVLAAELATHDSLLFIGRDALYPIALEGALKLKELSYIHAEGYTAGELKHGPLALIDSGMPVIALAPQNALIEKLKLNLRAAHARGAKLYLFTDQSIVADLPEGKIITLPETHPDLIPITYLTPLHLLAYHTALHRGTNIDQPRNLAKSVTVE